MARLALSDDDARVRQWFAEEIKSLGCRLQVDQLGNMFARKAGSASAAGPMIAMGSHLDTQPRGGRYDGILGILAALEVLHTLQENGYTTRNDIGVVNWTKYAIHPVSGQIRVQLSRSAAKKDIVKKVLGSQDQ